MEKRQFGVSTHLYRSLHLCREHLLEIAAHGFESVDVVAAVTHLDATNPTNVANLQQWLAEAGLVLHGIHAPVGATTPEEIDAALFIARRIPVQVFIAHLEGTRAVARKSIERLATLAAPLGVTLALEVVANETSRPGALVHFIERDLDGVDARICLDIGHAHLDGDVTEAIETVSEHLAAVEVHDNRGRTDDHLMPFDGTIDWAAALTAVQKIGYDGPLIFEMSARGSTKETLARARMARERMERLLTN